MLYAARSTRPSPKNASRIFSLRLAPFIDSVAYSEDLSGNIFKGRINFKSLQNWPIRTILYSHKFIALRYTIVHAYMLGVCLLYV